MNIDMQAARATGFNQGWDHAAYADAYGGALNEEPREADIPQRFKNEGTDIYYTSGWVEGVESYNEALYEAA